MQGTSLPWTPCQGPSWTRWWPKAVPKSNKNTKMQMFAYRPTGVPSPFSLLNSSTKSEHNDHFKKAFRLSMALLKQDFENFY